MQSFAVETLRPHPVRDLKAKIILHLPVAALVGNEEVTLTSKPDRNGIAIDRHFSLEIAEEREAVPWGHRDVLRQAEELTDTAVAPWGRREGVGRVPLDDDYMAAPSPTRQVIGDTGADDSTANYENVAVHCPIPCHPTVIVATGGLSARPLGDDRGDFGRIAVLHRRPTLSMPPITRRRGIGACLWRGQEFWGILGPYNQGGAVR